MAAAVVAAVRRNLLNNNRSDEVIDDFSAFKQVPSVEERLIDFDLNIRLRG